MTFISFLPVAFTAKPPFASASPINITVSWNWLWQRSILTPTYQVVVNPLLRRSSPIHSAVFKYISALDTDLVRFQAWLLYPKLVVPEIDPPQCPVTSWNFTYLDPLVEDFMNATKGMTNVMNIPTTPAWFWVTNATVPYPANPDQSDWTYGYQGTELRDPSMKQITDYHERLFRWYTQGGFEDECGISHTSSNFYTIDHFEILNEIELEHQISPEVYTKIYDSVVDRLRKISPRTKFVGLVLADSWNATWYMNYFLNQSNHNPVDIPLDYISYHYYAFPSPNDTHFADTMFNMTDGFILTVEYLDGFRKLLSPETKVDINEMGVISGDYRDPDLAPNMPPGYWNMAAAQYAYAFGKISALGTVEGLGMSQYIGYPGNFPTLDMVDPNSGTPNARYWALRMLIEHLGSDHGTRNIVLAGTELNVSAMLFAQAYVATHRDGKTLLGKILMVNKGGDQLIVVANGISGGEYEYVDLTTGSYGQPNKEVLQSDQLVLGGYAVAVVSIPL